VWRGDAGGRLERERALERFCLLVDRSREQGGVGLISGAVGTGTSGLLTALRLAISGVVTVRSDRVMR
jgi:hypothetical protein